MDCQLAYHSHKAHFPTKVDGGLNVPHNRGGFWASPISHSQVTMPSRTAVHVVLVHMLLTKKVVAPRSISNERMQSDLERAVACPEPGQQQTRA